MSEFAMANTASLSYADPSQPDRQSIVKEFEWAVTDLQMALAELHERLLPVLRPEPPIASDSQPEPPVSEARQRLRDLQRSTAGIRFLLERLEV